MMFVFHLRKDQYQSLFTLELLRVKAFLPFPHSHAVKIRAVTSDEVLGCISV